MRRILMAILLIVTVTTLAQAEDGYISICSFNIAELGTSTPDKDHQAIADMIADYDLIVVQEVQDKDDGGAAHIAAIVETLNLTATSPYSYIVIPGAGRGYPGNEGYAYIYRSPVILHPIIETQYGLFDTEVDYGRIPGWAYFQAGDFDFIVVAVHLHWSNHEKRAAGVADLLNRLKTHADKPISEERDYIIVGDFNRFGDYTVAEYDSRDTAFHQLLDNPTLDDKYRLLFCEHLVPDTEVRIFEESLETDTIPTSAGNLDITYLGHASLMFEYNGKVIHVDPVSSEADYSKLPDADMIFVTHEHGDHLDATAINQIKTEGTTIVYTEACAAKVSGGLVMANRDEFTLGWIEVEAIPAYNIVNTQYHSKGVGNGYVFTFGDKRVYVAGDTENIPEMKALKDIDAAFLPMNLPYTMTPEMVADAALSFNPTILYPYHYGSTDTSELTDIYATLTMDAKESYTDAGSTTVAESNMVYSQIVISQGVFNEFGEAQASLGSNIGINDFDNTLTYADMATDEIKDLVSEHRPIWAMFRYDLGDDDGEVTGVNEVVPVELKLYGNYPNPFNPSTTITFDLPNSSHVKLSVYNLSGQLVDTLLDETVTAGSHDVVWKPEGVASGVYQCVVESGTWRHSKKMTLVR